MSIIIEIMLLILDVDGVLTDGRKYYDASGRAVLKTFCDRDFTAIKKFKAAGWNVVFLSGDPNINESIAKNRNIPFYCNRVDGKMTNKYNFLKKFKEEYNVTLDDMVYVGDDIFDYDILSAVGWGFCPSNSDPDVMDIATVLNAKGGECCIGELYEYFKRIKKVGEVYAEDVEKFDRNELF